MGRNIQKNNKKKPQPKQESQEQQDYQEVVASDQSQDQLLGQQSSSQVILVKIQQKIQNGTDGQKLTWAALHSLKTQQKDLNFKMNQQIRQIQSKYQKLQKPIADKVSSVISGELIDKKYYQIQSLKQLNLQKIKPIPIQQFWYQIIIKSNLSSFIQQCDIQILKKCKKITSTIKDYQKNKISLSMEFHQNNYFKNNKLQINIGFIDQNNITKVLTQPIQYKNQKQQNSFFTFIFEKNQEDNQGILQALTDFHNAYINAIRLYFQKYPDSPDDEDIKAFMDNNQDDDQDQDQDNNDDDDEQSQQFQGKKPSKKQKKNEKPDPIQKPECKQQ